MNSGGLGDDSHQGPLPIDQSMRPWLRQAGNAVLGHLREVWQAAQLKLAQLVKHLMVHKRDEQYHQTKNWNLDTNYGVLHLGAVQFVAADLLKEEMESACYQV